MFAELKADVPFRVIITVGWDLGETIFIFNL